MLSNPKSSTKNPSQTPVLALAISLGFFYRSLRPFLDQVIQTLNLDLKIIYELEEDHSILGFVSAGFGIALMPEIVSISAYPVKKIKISNVLPERKIYLVSKVSSPKLNTKSKAPRKIATKILRPNTKIV